MSTCVCKFHDNTMFSASIQRRGDINDEEKVTTALEKVPQKYTSLQLHSKLKRVQFARA